MDERNIYSVTLGMSAYGAYPRHSLLPMLPTLDEHKEGLILIITRVRGVLLQIAEKLWPSSLQYLLASLGTLGR